MNSFFLALQFLTRFPIPYETNFNESEAGKSLFWFPFISAFMGFLVGCAQNITFPIAPQISGFVALMVLYLLNGGLHLDGLADTADGFLSYRDRDETLRIMHDSTIGTYGVVALVFHGLFLRYDKPRKLSHIIGVVTYRRIVFYLFLSHSDVLDIGEFF